MLRAYRAGDTPKQIAWKALAREQGLLTKEFSATASSELWIDLDEAIAADLEARLSILTHWVIQAERFGQSYGLRLPGLRIPPLFQDHSHVLAPNLEPCSKGSGHLNHPLYNLR